MTNDLAVFGTDELEGRIRYAKALAASSLLPDNFRDKPANVLLVLELGRSLGIEPITALSSISVVKGRPTMSAELMRALIARAGHHFRILVSSPTVCTIAAARREHPDEPSTFDYTLEDAQLAGLAGSDNYRKHPKAMLLARCTTMTARAVFADVIAGINYTPDELDEPVAPARVYTSTDPAVEPIDITDAVLVDEPTVADMAREQLDQLADAYTRFDPVGIARHAAAAGRAAAGVAPVGNGAPAVPADAPATVDVGPLTGPAARAKASQYATTAQLDRLAAFASSIGYDSLEAYLASSDVATILGGRPSIPLLRSHASELITAAAAFEATGGRA